ncbi:MAG: DEAD/DEAH box helicase [Candidatus Bathyarchaeia archaeon]
MSDSIVDETNLEKVLLCLSRGLIKKEELEQELGFAIPKILFEEKLIKEENGAVALTRRGESSLSFLESVREITALEPELETTLTTLEKMEEELINLGFYDVITTPETLAGKMRVSPREAEEKLEELAKRMYVLRMFDEHGNIVGYRSRIAEITRLVSLLKQRFSKDDIYEAPSLVSSVKLRVKDRNVTRRSIPVEELTAELEGYIIDEFKDPWKDVGAVVESWLKYFGIEKVSNFQRETALKIFSVLQRMEVERDDKKYSMALVAETGAGKTEAYFIPFMIFLLLRKIIRRESKAKKTRLIVVYPRVALSLNQLSRFTRYAYQINKEIGSRNLGIKVQVGIDNESIPRNPESLLKGEFPDYYQKSWRVLPDSDRIVYERMRCPVLDALTDKIKFQCCREIYYDLKNREVLCGESKGHRLPLRLFKDHIYGHSDIDVVIMTPNTMMRRLFESDFIRFLTDTGILVLVLDECHLYSSLPGAHMALICRRIKKLIETIGVKTFMLGISATMSSAEEFFKELVGYKPEVLSPKEEELERKSVEYYLFVKPEVVSLKRVKLSFEEEDVEESTEEEMKPVKPLSTMIQTLMCVMHNMRRTPLKNKGLGFVDSIDTLHRWYSAQKDAEQRELFRLRTEIIKNGEINCEKCTNGPIITCPMFTVGECWYYAKFDRFSIGLNEQIKFGIYYSERREEFEETINCILSTSALEVGYDDPKLIAFFQYKGPQSIISFAQRKGRVARSPEDRPINVLVLNPYSSKDNFIFVNDDYIVNSEYNEIPLNVENYYVQRDHFRAAIVDCIAYKDTSLSVTYDTPLYDNIASKIVSTISGNENYILEWVKNVASIYYKSPQLAKRALKRVKEELTKA